MAKLRPPKRILESYTIKGSDKVIKRECPFRPVRSRIYAGGWGEGGFAGIFGGRWRISGYVSGVSVSGPWDSGRLYFGVD
ncbi:unnamed protein product [Miscanthus lutarioriparius]|uniref:Uncharacterized protein n=1 Tax=Miscanthus lutarioriparius TaxID=422564 RepID=A0A811NR04_9POAL|nr:unnamed protein product [Miscanthus lutarioriparius]